MSESKEAKRYQELIIEHKAAYEQLRTLREQADMLAETGQHIFNDWVLNPEPTSEQGAAVLAALKVAQESNVAANVAQDRIDAIEAELLEITRFVLGFGTGQAFWMPGSILGRAVLVDE